MDSIYYCSLCDAEFSTSEEWNTHVNVCFFYFSLLEIIFLHFHHFLNQCLYVYIFCINFTHIFSSRLWCSAISWYNMFEPVWVMFIYDWILPRYVWSSWLLLCCRSKKLLINQFLFSSSAGYVYIFVYLL